MEDKENNVVINPLTARHVLADWMCTANYGNTIKCNPLSQGGRSRRGLYERDNHFCRKRIDKRPSASFTGAQHPYAWGKINIKDTSSDGE